MRIAVVGPAYPYKGGSAQHTTELAHRLAAAGHEVRLESWSAQYPRFLYPGEQTTTEPDLPAFRPTFRTLSWRRPDSWWRVGRRLRSRVDAVVLAVFSPVQVPAYRVVRRALRGSGVRVVALCHNVEPHERSRVDGPLLRSLLTRVDAVLVHSEEQAAHARAMTRVPVRVATMAPHLPATRPGSGVAAAPAAVDSGVVRERLLFFGIVRPYKGLDVLLRALAAGPEGVALTVAGEFWQGAERYRRLIDELGLGARVRLRPGYVPASEMAGLFGSVDALVLPYRSATSSQNAWIAFEHGVPVIATRAGALADPVTDGVDGIVCEPGDVGSLTEALRRFYRPGVPQRLRAAVRPVDPEPYWKRYVDALTEAATRPLTTGGSAGGAGRRRDRRRVRARQSRRDAGP